MLHCQNIDLHIILGRSVDCEYFFGEVWKIAFFKGALDFTVSHLITNLEFIIGTFRRVRIIVQCVPHLLFVVCSNLCGFHLDTVMHSGKIRQHVVNVPHGFLRCKIASLSFSKYETMFQRWTFWFH